jgi:hypothetical protein
LLVKTLVMMLLPLTGLICGQLLYHLPFRLFFRHSTWLTQEELRAAFPEKAWVTRAALALVISGFVLFGPLFLTTDVKKEINWFFLPVVGMSWMATVPAVPELLAGVSILVPLGKNSRRPLLFTVGPNASRAGVFRLAMTSLIVAVFLLYR